jgi:hypothetical protein
MLSCTNAQQPSLHTTRDSIMRDYFTVVDSIPYFDTLKEDFKLLKAYHKNDISYLRDSYNDLLGSLRSWDDFDTTTDCNIPIAIHLLHYEEAYRFSYKAAFCDTLMIMTIGKQKSEIVAEIMLYATDMLTNRCEIVKQLHKKMNQQAWEKLIKGIRYADFWGLKTYNDVDGFDGSSLYVFGFKSGINAFKERHKVIYRWTAERTAIGTVFKDMLDESGINVSCFRYNRLNPHNAE